VLKASEAVTLVSHGAQQGDGAEASRN
jgi:hypothetical protein